jgi:hypothetical protein
MIKMKEWRSSMRGDWKNINDIIEWRKALINGVTIRNSMNNSLRSRFVL